MHEARKLVTESIELAFNLTRARIAANVAGKPSEAPGQELRRFYRLCHLERLAHERTARRLEKLLKY